MLYVLTSGEYSDYALDLAVEFDGDIAPILKRYVDDTNAARAVKEKDPHGSLREWLLANGARAAEFAEVWEQDEWLSAEKRCLPKISVTSRGAMRYGAARTIVDRNGVRTEGEQ